MERVLSLIEHYGYLVILFGVMLESTGVPLPGETILLAAGVLAQRGHLDVGDAVVFGILGAVIGDQIGYWVGREGGRPFVLRWGRYVFITPREIGTRRGVLRQAWGQGRIPGTLLLRLARVRRPGRRHKPDALGDLHPLQRLGRSCLGYGGCPVGLLPGSSIGLVERWLGRATLVLAAMVAVVVGFYLAYRWAAHNRSRLVGWGEAVLAYPPVARLRTRYDAQLRWLLVA